MHFSARSVTRPVSFAFAFLLAAAVVGCKEETASNSPAASSSTAKAADPAVFDAAKLPRVSGAKETFANKDTAIFTSPDPVAQTADKLEAALAAAGWQKYAAPNTAAANDPAMRIVTLKRGPYALNVFVSTAPAQNNATSVQYSALPLKTDLPFLKDATNIEYSPDRPLLTLVTAEPADKVLDFYRKEMAALGWSLWSLPLSSKQPAGGPSGIVHEKGGRAYYVSDADPSSSLVLALQTTDGGKSKLEIKAISARDLQDAYQAYIMSDNRDTPPVDVARVVRLDGAQVVADRTAADKMTYSVAGSVPDTVAAVKKLLAADGWKQFVAPMEEKSSLLWFKKGRQGLSVSFTQTMGQPGNSSVYYSPKHITYAVPFPADAEEAVFDDIRPYFSAATTAAPDTTREFLRKELTAAGWLPLSTADATAKWPGATIDPNAAYYLRGKDRVISVSLKPQGGKSVAEVRVPPFARPQTVEFDKEFFGLPSPKGAKTAGGTGGNRPEAHAHIQAELGPVLAFYRRELTARGWQEQAEGAVNNPDAVTLNFTSPQGPLTLKLTSKYDFTVSQLDWQMVKPQVQAQAQAPAAPADPMDAMMNQMIRDALGGAMNPVQPGARPQAAPPQASGDTETLKPLANNTAPVPVPDTAEDINVSDGKLEFTSQSSVKSVADFYRATMRQQGWQSQNSVINNPNMVVLNFNKGRDRVNFTIMKMGPKTNVSADGSALKTAAAPAAPGAARGNTAAAADKPSPAATADDLIVEESGGLPAPKRHTSMGSERTPFRRELTATVPLSLADVLGFYRGELGKRGWKEEAKDAVTQPDNVRLAWTTPEGPAVLKLSRKEGATEVTLSTKNPEAAAKAGLKPKPDQAKIVFGNINDADATITFNNKPIKVGAGVGSKAPDGPSLDVAPGKYKYSVRLPGQPAQTEEVEVKADEVWGLMIGPGGVLPIQAY